MAWPDADWPAAHAAAIAWQATREGETVTVLSTVPDLPLDLTA